jgi:hypothetical protein
MPRGRPKGSGSTSYAGQGLGGQKPSVRFAPGLEVIFDFMRCEGGIEIIPPAVKAKVETVKRTRKD